MKVSPNPKISIIMSVYNGMPYLRKAADSILKQTYKNFEFIIVDDASKDETWKYLKSLKDARIRLIKNKKNLGLATSLNIALKRARGDYIARMDADDISLPKRLSEQINFLLEHPSVDLCGSWVKLINNHGEIIGRIHRPTSDKMIKKMINCTSPVIVHPTWMAKTKVFRYLKGYDPRYDRAEDYEFLLRAKKFKFANLPKELLLWRSHKERRSQSEIQKMYRSDFKVKFDYFRKGEFGILFLPHLIYKFCTTYLVPPSIKLLIAKKLKLS